MMLDRSPPLRLPAAQHQFTFDPAAEPALVVEPGDTIIVETLDCFSGKLTADSPLPSDDADVLQHIGGHYNPVNRPIFVRGAEPGDRLEVEVLDIVPGKRQGFAVTHVAHDWAVAFGGREFADSVAPAMIVASLENGRIRLPLGDRIVDRQTRPMIGTIGTAPAGEAASSLLYAPGHGGNLDCPGIQPGTTVILPVNVGGALLSLGDIHALMGDGEITGTAFETSADVTIRIAVRKSSAGPLSMPRLRDADSFGSIGCGSRTSLQENIRTAVLDLAQTLRLEHDVPAGSALQLINLFGKIVVNQAVGTGDGGWCSVLVRMFRSDIV